MINLQPEMARPIMGKLAEVRKHTMTTEMIETTSTRTVEINGTTETGVAVAQPEVVSEATRIVDRVKASVQGMKTAEARGRTALAEMVATFVEMGEAYINNEVVCIALDIECAKFGLTPVKEKENPSADEKALNVFLPLVRMIDGEWEQVIKRGKPAVNTDNTPKMKWVPNRSFEKYASVIEFFIYNGYGHAMVADMLLSKDLITIVDGDPVEPLITAIVEANTKQQNPNGRERTVWTEEAKAAAAALKPIFVILTTEKMKSVFALSEGEYGTAIIRRGANGFEILGNAGMKDNALLGLVKRQTSPMELASKKASSLSDEVINNG